MLSMFLLHQYIYKTFFKTNSEKIMTGHYEKKKQIRLQEIRAIYNARKFYHRSPRQNLSVKYMLTIVKSDYYYGSNIHLKITLKVFLKSKQNPKYSKNDS